MLRVDNEVDADTVLTMVPCASSSTICDAKKLSFHITYLFGHAFIIISI